MGTTLKLMQNYIAIKEVSNETMTQGGLYVPDTAKKSFRKGTIVRVGPGRYENGIFVETTLSEGDVVFFPEQSLTATLQTDDETFLILRETDVCAKL
jgi:chaperonin GroES